MITPTTDVPLTKGYGDLDSAIKASVPGMAYFASTGPREKSCYQCRHWGGKKVRRDENGYLKPVLCRLAVAWGARANCGVPAQTPSCKYFEQRAKVVDLQGKPRVKKVRVK